MTEIRIYFEGDDALRSGFREFFRDVDAAADQRRLPRLKLIAGEAKAVRDFMHALKANPDAWNILLVDTEGPDDGHLLTKLKERRDWQPPDGTVVHEGQVQFMVQVMEAWLLADRHALSEYYGREFQAKALPKNEHVETISKDDVRNKLKRATRGTSKGAYHKTRHAPGLLGRIDPAAVRAAAPACDRLFKMLLSKLGDST